MNEPAGRNESEPHQMSLENDRPGEKPSRYLNGEGRRAQSGKPSASGRNSGGVSVDSTSGSDARVSWESCGGGKAQPSAQAGETGEAGRITAAVGNLHSSVDLWAMAEDFRQSLPEDAPREVTCSMRASGSGGSGMAGESRTRTPGKVRSLQIALYRKAKAEPKYRFWSLYGELLRWDVLEWALKEQERNGGIAGVDGESLAQINVTTESRRGWLEGLQAELKTKSYRPSPVLRVYIEKAGGGQRGLGIPTVRDRVVQTALALILMPIWEADFHPHSHGFRPKRNAHQAIDGIVEAVRHGKTEIIDADLSKYFDSIPHGELMRQVARRVSDGSVLKLIKAWLGAPIVEEDKRGKRRVTPTRCGTPQGGVISPLLANIYLNGLDHGVNERCKGRAEMHRYADDFVICCRPGQSGEILERLKRWLEAKGLKLNEEKTRVVDIRHEGMDFLGFNITWRQSKRRLHYPHVEPSAKSQAALRRKLREQLNHWTLWRPVRENVARVNRVLRGWAGYFHYRNSSAVMDDAMTYARDRLRRWVWRKHACSRGLWKHYPNSRLHDLYGLYAMPTTAGWKAKR
jgi:group II intron reverse transcriptase/maturase